MHDTTAPMIEHPFPTRQRYEDGPAAPGTSPAPAPPLPPSPKGAGEPLLTAGQQVALLKMRGSDWSKAVVQHLKAFGRADCDGADYRALAAAGFAVNKGSFHVLTSQGRWLADRVACDIARSEGLHVVTYDLFPRSRGAASAKCTCGWCTYVSRTFASYVVQLGSFGRHHLEHVGAFVAGEAGQPQ